VIPGEAAALERSAELPEVVRTGIRVGALRFANAAVAFVASIAVSRALGPAGRGAYALPIAVVGIAFALGHLGLEHAHAYQASQGVTLRRLWANASVAALGLGAMAMAVLLGVEAVAARSTFGSVPFAWILLVAIQLPVLLQTLYWSGLLQLAGRLAWAAVAPLVGNVVFAAVAIAAGARGELTPFRGLVLWTVSNVIVWAALLAACRRSFLVGERPHLATLRRGLIFGSKAYVGVTLFYLLLRIDQVLVERFVGWAALGVYSLAVVLAEVLWLATDPFAASVLRHQVAATGGRERELADATSRVSLVVAIPLGILAWTVAPFAVALAYGDAFDGVVWPFRLLLPGVVALSMQRPLGAVLVKEGRVWLVTWFGILTVGVNVALNLILLPRIGAPGAAIASSVGYAMLTFAYVTVTRGSGGWRSLVPGPHDVGRIRTGLLASVGRSRPSPNTQTFIP
jgi:O-antigen/teichoic acid export membrane protein